MQQPKIPGYFEDVSTSFEQQQFALKPKELHHCHSCNRSFVVHGQRRGMLQVKQDEADSKIVVSAISQEMDQLVHFFQFFSRYLLLIQQHCRPGQLGRRLTCLIPLAILRSRVGDKV